MNIRKATYRDAPEIHLLLQAQGYTARISLLVDALETAFQKEDHEVFVCELKRDIVGFASVHCLPQLAFDGDVMIISCLCVDEASKSLTIAKELEEYIASQAKVRKCERIEMQCMSCQAQTHEFYIQQGYGELPKHYLKSLNNNEQ
jgi:N-acetylglutamate synthase-like GNAT family acetyltransferase